MDVRARALFGGLALSFALAACGGGGSSNPSPPPPPPVPGPGSVSISPSSLSFGGPGAAAQTFTVSSTVGPIAAPSLDNLGCAPVASISTSSTTLPAVYTVTPTGNGNCSVVVNLGHGSATIGINVGGSGPSINTNTNAVNLFVGGTSGSVLTGASSGIFTADSTACNGIATVTSGPFAGSATYNQIFTIAPVAPGTCQLTLVDGSSSITVSVVVNASPNGPNALSLTQSTMDFASIAAAPQQDTLNFTGNVGQVSINEDDCIGKTGKPKIAFLTLNGVPPGTPVSLPQSFTVTLYGNANGTCAIHFVPQFGSEAVLTVTVH